MKMDKKSFKSRMVSSMTGLILGMYLLLFLQEEVQLGWMHNILIFVVYFTLGYILTQHILLQQLKKFMQKPKKVKHIILTLSICFCTITFIIGLKNAGFEKVYIAEDVTITALGEKNEQSLGTEVWLFDIEELKNNEGVDEFDIKGDWEYRDNGIVSYKNQPNQIHLSFKKHTEPINLRFLRHAYSGIIQIEQGTKVENIDLYAQEGNTLEYLVSNVAYKMNIRNVIRIILLEYLLMIAVIVGFSTYFNKLRYDEGNIYDKR